MTRLFSNNASTTLSAAITTTSQTSISVVDGSSFPNPVSPDFFVVTLTQSSSETSWEDVQVTARSGNNLTIVRGFGGTTPATWASGSKVEIRWDAVAAADAANTGYTGSAILDFGSTPGGNYAITTVYGQTDIKSTSKGSAFLMATSSADHNVTEHLVVPMNIRIGNIVAGTSFDIIAYSPIRLSGVWAVEWVRTR